MTGKQKGNYWKERGMERRDQQEGSKGWRVLKKDYQQKPRMY